MKDEISLRSANEEVPAPASADPPLLPLPSERRGIIHQIFWNREGLRAAWRLVILLAIFALCAIVLGSLIRGFLQFPPKHFAPRVLMAGDGVLALAAILATAIMRTMEKRTFAHYALPWHSAFGLNFWWGVLWGWVALTGLLLLIRYYRGFDFGTLAVENPRRTLLLAVLWAVSFLAGGNFAFARVRCSSPAQPRRGLGRRAFRRPDRPFFLLHGAADRQSLVRHWSACHVGLFGNLSICCS